MEKTFKNFELMAIQQSVNELMQLDLPFKMSWNLKKNAKAIAEILKDFAEFESKLIEKYSIKDEKGKIRIYDNNQYKIFPAKIDVFNKERNELLNCESTIDLLTIKINLSDMENCKVKSSTLYNLDFMIEVVDDNSEEEKSTAQ